MTAVGLASRNRPSSAASSRNCSPWLSHRSASSLASASVSCLLARMGAVSVVIRDQLQRLGDLAPRGQSEERSLRTAVCLGCTRKWFYEKQPAAKPLISLGPQEGF